MSRFSDTYYEDECFSYTLKNIDGKLGWLARARLSEQTKFKNAREINGFPVISFNSAFQNYPHSKIDISELNTDEAVDFSLMFCYSNIEEIDLRSLNTKNAKDIDGIFEGCNSLKKIINFDLNICHLENRIWHGFDGCYDLKTLHLTHLYFTDFHNMEFALTDCESLDTLILFNYKLRKGLFDYKCLFHNKTTKLPNTIITDNIALYKRGKSKGYELYKVKDMKELNRLSQKLNLLGQSDKKKFIVLENIPNEGIIDTNQF